MSETIEITLPADELEGTTAKLSHWLVDVGSPVVRGEPILELETDKVSMEICAPASGLLQEIIKQPGDKIEPDMVLGRLRAGAQTSQTGVSESSREIPVSLESPAAANGAKGANGMNGQALIGPAVRKLVREHSLDLSQISGSGRGGRVTREDVMTFLQSPQSAPTVRSGIKLPASKLPVSKLPASKSTLAGKRIPHSPMRQSIARHMVESLLHTAPHVTSVFELDMSNVIEHRRWHKKEFADQGINLTFTAYFLAASVAAIQTVPQVNSRFHEDALEVFEQINIGVGTALGDKGLVVPVVESVQSKTLFEIAEALQSQTEKARSGKLTPADMKNGTFTISNHGVSGSLFATPIIINQPQVAILGVGKLEKRVVVREVDGRDEMQIKPMCYVSLSIDHRALDASQTNQFLSLLVETLERWGQ